ncbi:MAG TPA: diguanylate cyclase [Thermoleophilia bacterium]|nr:diguanylate cyclase [Thermoleophilia bacterium]HQG54068.1 diguanylate cyclase [Thermoleophilia bacterium]HQJ97617.1 diguanylate cyclase [Thermoleophilia bacterium]
MSPRRRDPRHPALLRSRLRVFFFVLLCVATAVWGGAVPLAAAGAGLVAAFVSLDVARRRGDDLAYTFVVLDWLLLGVIVAAGGNAGGPFVAAVAAVPFFQLLPSPRADWPFLILPTLAMLVVLGAADPSFGGDRATGVLTVAALTATGAGAAALLRRPPRRAPVVSVDATTGFHTPRRLPELFESLADTALREHSTLGVVSLRLAHFQDVRDFAGHERSEALVAVVARRIRRHLESDDLAFRVAPDVFVLALPGRDLASARAVAAAVDDDVSASLIGGRRQHLQAGAACFPTVRRLDDLLREADADARRVPAELGHAAAR